jgi:signal transduction histidine kinase
VITAQNQQLHNMIDRLLLLQTMDETKIYITACRLSALLQPIVSSWQIRAGQKGIHLEWDEKSEESSPILANPGLLEEVINNLLENAIKFSPTGATVRIGVKTKSGEAHIAIVDQGIGIAPEKQKHIFDQFYQVNGSSTRAVGGMGIGLALCMKIIKAHRGRLWVDSLGEGKGSTFTVALPFAQE